MKPQIWSRELGPYSSNCYIMACPQTKKAAVIDPGEPDPWIKRTITENGLQVQVILLTHGHLDHIGGVEWVKSFTQAPVWVHSADASMLQDPRLNGSGRSGNPMQAPPPDRLLTEGDEVNVGNLTFHVIHTPGHSPGGICFYISGHLVAGDTLFAGSVGRTDLPGGSHDALIDGIKRKLLILPPDTVVYPGHGPTSSIGDEKAYNPFL